MGLKAWFLYYKFTKEGTNKKYIIIILGSSYMSHKKKYNDSCPPQVHGSSSNTLCTAQGS